MNNPIESKPLFAVGEAVLLQSVNRPELKGEDVVLGFLLPGEHGICPKSGKHVVNNCPMIGYFLASNHPSTVLEGVSAFWGEKSLRKRHQPSEHSFEDLKTILYLPQSRDEIARLERGMQA